MYSHRSFPAAQKVSHPAHPHGTVGRSKQINVLVFTQPRAFVSMLRGSASSTTSLTPICVVVRKLQGNARVEPDRSQNGDRGQHLHRFASQNGKKPMMQATMGAAGQRAMQDICVVCSSSSLSSSNCRPSPSR